MKTILISGAAGDVGTHLRNELAGKYALRLSDIRPIKKLAPGETFVRGDVGRLSDMLRVTRGAEAIVHHADKYGMRVLCMRIGNVNPAPVDKRRLSIWISPRDFGQLVTIGIEHPDIRFEIVYGVSGNRRSWYDNSNAERLGYRPQDDAEACAAAVLAKEKPGADPRAETFQGGNFVLVEIGGDPSRPLPKTRKRKR